MFRMFESYVCVHGGESMIDCWDVQKLVVDDEMSGINKARHLCRCLSWTRQETAIIGFDDNQHLEYA